MFPYTPSDLGGVFFVRKRLKKGTAPKRGDAFSFFMRRG